MKRKINFKIEKKLCYKDGLLADIEYKIIYDVGIPNGSGRLELTTVSLYPIITKLFPGVKESDKLAEVGSFYPQGFEDYDRIEKYSRQGIGTALLNQMIADAKETENKIMSVSTNEHKMQSLVKKHGFIPCMIDVWYFKKL